MLSFHNVINCIFTLSSFSGQDTMPPSCNAVNNQVVSATQSPSGSQVQRSSVANLAVPKTPHRSDRYVSLTEISPVATCNGEANPSCYTTVSNERVMVSPAKQMAYIETSSCISPVEANIDKASKRDHIRSRLDFDTSDVPENLDKSLPNEAFESDKQVDIPDIDFSNLEMNYSFSEILSDLGISCEDIDFYDHPALTHSKDNASGSSHECNANQVTFELPSAPAEAVKKT
ncbi:flocculation protein FLO1 [Spatholobus suberectus]|nr:flocculation protein FLO1 [Spatholobus suberectus]